MIINHHDNQVSVEYVADEFGFHPVGSHIPVAPPMPPHVRCADYVFNNYFLFGQVRRLCVFYNSFCKDMKVI